MRQIAPRIFGVALLLSGCASMQTSAQPKQWALPVIGSVNGLAAGPDGRTWFTIAGAKAVGAIDANGNVQTYQEAINIDADGERIAAGPDGAMWLTQVNPHAPVDSGPDMIGRITTGGEWSEYPIPSWDARPLGIAAGPDGAMWFAERHANAIGRITMKGRIQEFGLPHDGSGPTSITGGPDGRMWFTETDGDRIGAISPSTDAIAEFTVPVAKSKPGPIAGGRDGKLYFIELATHGVEAISVTGAFDSGTRSTTSSAHAPHQAGIRDPVDIVESSDHSLWIIDASGSIVASGPSAPIVVSLGDTSPNALAAGPHGTIWFAERKGPTFSYTGTAGIGMLTAHEGR